MHKFFKDKNLLAYLAAIILVFLAVFVTNFPFNLHLTGWDNLHPEFNFSSNFSRGIQSVWQTNQGLGTYGGHGYAASLPHTTIIFLFSLISPDMYLRAIFTFSCLLTGTLGIFFLTRKFLSKSEKLKNPSAFIASIFYLLNYGTVQNFYIQLESFIVHFASLPWLFFTCINFLEKPTKKNLFIFFGVSLAATIQGFIPPLFFVYMLMLSIFLLFYIIQGLNLRKLKLAFIIVITTLFANFYWLLPVILYSFSRSATYLSAYINLSSTDDFILKNQAFGKIQDIAILKGFISEAIDSQNGQVFLIFNQWNEHLSKISIQIIGYALFSLILFGTLMLAIKREIQYRWFLLVGFIVTFSLLATDTFPFSYVTQIMQEIPVLKQAFRIAFTKFSISVSFFYAISLGIATYSILLGVTALISAKQIRRIITTLLLLILSVLIIYFSWPIFSGNFLYSRTKITIPSIYFEMFSFFKNQDKNGRIMNLPQGWNWGWSVYDWGYSGSGFLWYGIDQPIMDRSFDPWGKANENYYWELNHAIYSEDFNQFEKILDKYNISWIVLDKNIVPYLDRKGVFYTAFFEKYLDSSNKFTLVETFNPPQGTQIQPIKIYKINRATQKGQVEISQPSIKNILPSYSYNDLDQAFSDYGMYSTNVNQNADVYYPFRSLFSNTIIENKLLIESNISIEKTGDKISITTSYPDSMDQYNPVIPPISSETQQLNPTVEKKEKSIIVTSTIPNDSYFTYDSKNDPNFFKQKPNNCSTTLEPKPNAKYLLEAKNNIVKLSSINSENCFSIPLTKLSQRYGYLIIVESRHIQGKPLQFAVINEESKKADIVYSLTKDNTFQKSYIFVSPMKFYGLSYNLFFNNISIGNKETINEIKSVEILPIPYDLLKGIQLTNPVQESKSGSVITNFQAYDSGWHAYTFENEPNFIERRLPFWFGHKLKDHVLVNNWANGWIIPESGVRSQKSEVIIIFLPQYLQYAGFLLLLGYTGVLVIIGLKSHFRNHHKNRD